jgi:hypothetical protein
LQRGNSQLEPFYATNVRLEKVGLMVVVVVVVEVAGVVSKNVELYLADMGRSQARPTAATARQPFTAYRYVTA